MYIVKQSGGDYEDSWTTNLFCTNDKSLAEFLIACLEKTRDAYESEWDKYREGLNLFLIEWEKQNPEPKKINLARPPKPTLPAYPDILKGLSKKQKKIHPFLKEWEKILEKFSSDIDAWHKLDYELRGQELAPYHAWLEAKKEAEKEFKENNFKNVSYIPKEWQEEVDSILGKDYFTDSRDRTCCSFLMEEIPVLTPKS